MSNDKSTKSTPLTADAILENILHSRGQFVKAIWKSNPTPAAVHKKAGIILEKRNSAVVRSGINFANLSAVKLAVENNERDPVSELPFGKWHVDSEGNSLFPYVISHTPKGSDEEVLYIRLYPTDSKANTLYYVNGKSVDKETFATYLTPSDRKKMTDGEAPLCFTVKKDNIIGVEDFEA